MKKQHQIILGLLAFAVVLFVLRKRGMMGSNKTQMDESTTKPATLVEEEAGFDPTIIQGKNYTQGELMQEQMAFASSPIPSTFGENISSRNGYGDFGNVRSIRSKFF